MPQSSHQYGRIPNRLLSNQSIAPLPGALVTLWLPHLGHARCFEIIHFIQNPNKSVACQQPNYPTRAASSNIVGSSVPTVESL
jgi:hypothetical protein